MKKICLLLSVLIYSVSLHAQYANPHVQWTFASKNIGGDKFDLIATATISKGFHLYSQFIGEGGPLPTIFTFDNSKGYKLIGKVKERGNRKEAIEPLFENMNLIWFEEKAVFTQRISISESLATITGLINFMTCDDKMCDPPSDQAFEFNVLAVTPSGSDKKTEGLKSDSLTSVTIVTTDSVFSDSTTGSADIITTDSITATDLAATDIADDTDVRNMSYWQIFIAGFGYGLIALLMPCVWPVMPLTISYFLKHNKEKNKGRFNAALYGFSIVLIFVLLGILVSLFTNEQQLNSLSTGWFFNILFFVLFFLFGLSFLGVFEIRVPSAWINKSESMSDRGGLIGIFFMAFTLVLVSFSCTLPFVANLISVVTQDGEFIKPLIGFSAFGLALGLPFGLFAWFPSGLKRLPKSGGWMNTVKVAFGFIEIALSFIYLSKVDMTYHWNILSRDIFLSIWIISFAVLGLYLLGKIKLACDGEISHISVPRLMFALLSMSFALYMIPGLWGAPLKPLSGFLPNYSEFTLNVPEQASFSAEYPKGKTKKYENLFESPLGLDLYFDYDQALARSRQLKKPLFVDFTGWGCVNCRKMEKSIWPVPQVLERLKNDYVTVSLYVDDRFKLPESEQYFSKALNKQVKTIGDRNFDLQYSHYKIGAQPYYVLLDNDGKLLNKPRGYTSDVSTYVKFLDDGIKEYESRQKLISSSQL